MSEAESGGEGRALPPVPVPEESEKLVLCAAV